MTSAKKIIAFPQRQVRRSKHELAFLPAALEITETPPSPIGRAIGATRNCTVLCGAGLGVLRKRRHRGDCAGQDHSERPHKGDPAV